MNTTQPTLSKWPSRIALLVVTSATGVSGFAADIILRIVPAAHVTWPTATNNAYQVLVATNVAGTYIPTGRQIEGTGRQEGAYFTATNTQHFYRVQESPSRGISWLTGVWEGTIYQPAFAPPTLSARMAINNTNGVYSNFYTNTTGQTVSAATLDLISFTDTYAEFWESIVSGDGVDGMLILTKVSGTNVIYNRSFLTGPENGLAFGVLNKK